jgi:hypothetical protein
MFRTCFGEDVRLSSSAVLGDLVLDWGLHVAVRAVVVARQDVGVHVAHADPVVGVLLAAFDAVLVALDAGIDDVLGGALVLRESGGGERNGAEKDSSAAHFGGWLREVCGY